MQAGGKAGRSGLYVHRGASPCLRPNLYAILIEGSEGSAERLSQVEQLRYDGTIGDLSTCWISVHRDPPTALEDPCRGAGQHLKARDSQGSCAGNLEKTVFWVLQHRERQGGHSWSQVDLYASGQGSSLSYITKRMKQLFKGLIIWHKRFWVRSKGGSIGVCK